MSRSSNVTRSSSLQLVESFSQQRGLHACVHMMTAGQLALLPAAPAAAAVRQQPLTAVRGVWPLGPAWQSCMHRRPASSIHNCNEGSPTVSVLSPSQLTAIEL